MSRVAPVRRWLVAVTGTLLGLGLYALDVDSHSGPVPSGVPMQRGAEAPAASHATRRGVFAMTSPSPAPRLVAASQRGAALPQEPPFPFSYLGKVTEQGETAILLYGAGRTLEVRHAGPLDDRYLVEDVLEDRVVIRDLPLGTRHVVELASRQYEVPGSLRGEYPQD